MAPNQCPQCVGPLQMHKDTVSGTEYREYDCPECGWSKEEDRGPALWKIIEESSPADKDKKE